MRVFLALVLSIAVPCALTAGGTQAKPSGRCVEFAEKRDLKSGSFAGYAEISLDQSSFAQGEHFTVRVNFFNMGGGGWFYNASFNQLITLPGVLLIYDSAHNCIGDLLGPRPGSRRAVSRDDWSWIPSEGSANKVFPELGADKVLLMLHGVPILRFPTGTYYLQMVFLRGFIQPPETADHLDYFYSRFDRTELFRSNVLKIEIR